MSYILSFEMNIFIIKYIYLLSVDLIFYKDHNMSYSLINKFLTVINIV